MNALAREQRAGELIGPYVVKTAGGIMLSQQKRVLDGFIYANSRWLLFLADAPLVGLPAGFPGQVDPFTIQLEISERPTSKLTAPFITPNGIITFADGVEFVGAKKRMKAIAGLLVR